MHNHLRSALRRMWRYLLATNPIILHGNAWAHIADAISFTTGDWRYWNIHHTHPIWVHEIMISLPKWKNYSEGHVTIQERKLFMLLGGHCWISTDVDTMMVYHAFHKFCRRWYIWGGGDYIEGCECVYLR
jgi:hypothetical protein